MFKKFLFICSFFVFLNLYMHFPIKTPMRRIKRLVPPKQNTHILSVSDSYYRQKYKAQMDTIKCYAQKHDHRFHYLDVKNCSNIQGFFFKKHCQVSQFLKSIPDDDIVFVFDGDVITKSDNLNMELPIDDFENDLIFYQRCWSKEIAAGNYIVKNSPQARKFLYEWSNWFSKQPKGFASADNGAIHLQILKSLYGTSSIRYQKCLNMYNNLTSSVHNLTSYWSFVACARESIPFNTSFSQIQNLRISLLHPEHSWIHDHVCNKKYVDKSPFLHGIKKESEIKKHFYECGRPSFCQYFRNKWHKTDMERDFIQILKYLHEILTENNIDYSIIYGTALGYARHHDFIPWDDDMDIAIRKKDTEKILSLIEKPFCTTNFWGGVKLYKCASPKAGKYIKYDWGFPFLDLFNNGDTGFNKKSALEKHIFPSQPIMMHGINLRAPKNITRHLELRYGNSALTTCVSPNYDHKDEVVVSPVKKVNCEEVVDSCYKL